MCLFVSLKPVDFGPRAFLFLLLRLSLSRFSSISSPNPLLNAFKPIHCAGWVCFFFTVCISDRGREKRFVRFPLPPNRTGGSPASGSPVDGFTPKGIDEPFHGRLTD